MSDQLNLLDLPDLVLEQIFSSCEMIYDETAQRCIMPLLNLTECNKFLKNYIENNPRLMKKIKLFVPLNTINDEEELEACAASCRKYVSISFYYSTSDGYDTIDKADFSKKKALADLHSASIKDVTLYSSCAETDSKVIIYMFKFLENMVNVEKVSLDFEGIHEQGHVRNVAGWDWSVFGKSYRFPNKFIHLKHLEIGSECETAFNIFKNCENIETLKFTGIGLEYPAEYAKLGVLFANSRKTLKTLKVRFIDIEEDPQLRNFTDFLEVLVNAEIDLKTFELDMELSTTSRSTKLLLKFLESQKNLENLEIWQLNVGPISDKEFGEAITGIVKLKTLELSWKNEKNLTDKILLPKYPLELEELKLRQFGNGKCEISYYMFQFKSYKLKKIEITGSFKVPNNFYESISRNFSSLMELKIGDCDHSSNDIFWILKHLKQLQILRFSFPKESKLNPDLFVNNGNLNLPVIKDVGLNFNDSIDIAHALKIVQLMSNMSDFGFNYWKNYSVDSFLVVVLECCVNLTNLRIFQHPVEIQCLVEIEYSVLLKVQAIVQKFNKKPEQFKIYGEDINYWMEEAQTKQAEAGSSMD